MRAQHQAGQACNLAFVAAADISDRVEMCAHSGIAHPAQHKVGRRAMLFGEEDAREMLGRFGDSRQFVDAANDLIAERRVLWPGAWLLHLVHAFPMPKAAPIRARASRPIDTSSVPAGVANPNITQIL